MARKQYRQLIVANLKMLSEWNDIEDGQSISEWSDSAVGEFFRTVVEDIRDEMEKKSPDSSVALAFREAKLQPDIPFNWANLLRAFAETHYRRKVAGKLYDDDFKALLWQRLKVIVDRQKKRSLLAACRELVTQFPNDYGSKQESGKRKSQNSVVSDHKKYSDKLRWALGDFGWSSSDFDHPTPPRVGRR